MTTSGKGVELIDPTGNGAMFLHPLHIPGHQFKRRRMAMPLPTYIVRGGEQTLCPPFLVKDVQTHSFIFQADGTALRALCDRNLNTPLRALTGNAPPFEYRPMSSFVLLSFSHLTATHAQSAPQAWVEEHEAILWILTMAGHEEHGVFIVDHLAWFTPYVFVDSPWAMITGQMVYGFGKEIADVRLAPNAGDPFTVDTTVVERFGYNSEATVQRLLTLRCVETRAGTHPELQTLEDVVKTILHRLPSEHHSFVLPDLHFLTSTAGDLMHGRMPMVLLKQIRDVADGAHACYQAIIEFDLTMQNVRSPRISFDSHALDIADYASHPIVSEFGFAASTVPAVLSASMTYDLTLGTGRVIASNLPR
jgi:hypothetical protein